jgi:hypothetical protein
VGETYELSPTPFCALLNLEEVCFSERHPSVWVTGLITSPRLLLAAHPAEAHASLAAMYYADNLIALAEDEFNKATDLEVRILPLLVSHAPPPRAAGLLLPLCPPIAQHWVLV